MNKHITVKVAKIFQAITYWPIYSALRFFVCFEVYGQENLKGLENKPIIFASNHASYIDGPISAAIMPRYQGEFYPKRFFPIRFLVLDKYFNWGYLLTAFYVRINGSIRIWRGTGGDLGIILKGAINALKNNDHIWIFPEGKMTQDGKLRQGKRGVTYLHQQTNAPIVPIYIKGTLGILSWKTLFRTRKVTVYIGQPINSLGNVSLEQGTAKVMSAIANLVKD